MDSAAPPLVKTCLLPAVFAVIALTALFLVHEPYRPLSEEWLPDGRFEAPPPLGDPVGRGVWRARGDVSWEPDGGYAGSGGMRLAPGERIRPQLFHEIDDIGSARAFLLRGWMKAVAEEDRSSRSYIGLQLQFRRADGSVVWRYPRSACRLPGTRDWTRCSIGVPVPPGAVGLRVAAIVLAPDATAWVDELTLREAVPTRSLTWFRRGVAIAWTVGAVAIAVALGLFRRRGGWLVLLLAGGIVAGVALPPDTVHSAATGTGALLADWLAESAATPAAPPPEPAAPAPNASPPRAANPSPGAPSAPPPEREPAWWSALAETARDSDVIQKGGHVLLFFLLGALASWMARAGGAGAGAAAGWVFLALVTFAAATETLQFAVFGRTPLLSDVLLDAAGAGAGIGLAGLASAARDALRPRTPATGAAAPPAD